MIKLPPTQVLTCPWRPVRMHRSHNVWSPDKTIDLDVCMGSDTGGSSCLPELWLRVSAWTWKSRKHIKSLLTEAVFLFGERKNKISP